MVKLKKEIIEARKNKEKAELVLSRDLGSKLTPKCNHAKGKITEYDCIWVKEGYPHFTIASLSLNEAARLRDWLIEVLE